MFEWQSARYNDIDDLRSLASDGVSLDSRDSQGRTGFLHSLFLRKFQLFGVNSSCSMLGMCNVRITCIDIGEFGINDAKILYLWHISSGEILECMVNSVGTLFLFVFCCLLSAAYGCSEWTYDYSGVSYQWRSGKETTTPVLILMP